MLRRLLPHPLLACAGEVLLDAVRYIATMTIMILLLSEAAELVS